MNIVLLRGRTDLTTRVWVWSLDTILGRCLAPKTAQPVGVDTMVGSRHLVFVMVYDPYI